MAERRSKIVLEAEARGFGATERAASKVKEALDVGKQAKGYGDLQKHVAGLGAALQRTSVAARQFGQSLDLKSKERDAYGLLKALREVASAVDEADEKKKRSKSFTRGVLQGAGVGEYFPENEDLGRNVAGRMVGRGIASAGRSGMSTAGSVWTGSQGLLQGLAGIPIVGGALSGGLGSALGMSQEYLQYAQVRQGAQQFNRVDPAGDRAFASAQAAQRAEREKALVAADWSDPGVSSVVRDWDRKGISTWDTRNADFDRRTNAMSGTELMRGGKPADEDTGGGGPADPFSRFGGAGLRFGMNLMESLQHAQGMAQMAGGSLQDISGRAFSSSAAAQARLGVGGDVAGAFLRADRLGGGGGGAEGFEQAITRGMQLGLEGSDLQRYMRDAAQALMQFETTGMPLDREALGAQQQQLSAMFGSVRGNNIANGFLQAGRGIASSGAQNATQFQLLRDVYGYGGGGTDDYFGAVQRAEKGGGDVSGFLSNLTQGGTSQSSKALILMSRLKNGLGINIGTDEASAIAGGDTGRFQRLLDDAAKRTQGFDLLKEGENAIDGNVRRQKGQENTRIGVGGKLVSAAQDFEDATIESAKSMAQFDKALKVFSELVKDGATDLGKLFEIIGGWVNAQVGSGKGG